MPHEFRVLGPLEVRRDGVALSVGGAKVRALLAALLIDVGRVVSTDTLIDALWPSSAPTDARHALEATASRLRHTLGGDRPVRNQPAGYLLDVDPQAVDAVRFRRLVAESAELAAVDPRRAALRADDALALWRGEPYAELAFEAFAREEVAELVELRLQAEEQRIDAVLAEGRAGEAIGEISTLVTAEPMRERRREQLMLALYASGRQADALAAFRDARAFLQGELGLEPSERLRELERAILRQDAVLTPPSRASLARPRTRRPASAVVVEPKIPLELDPEEHERRTSHAAAVVARVAEHYGARLVAPFQLVFLDEDHGATAAAAARELAETVSGDTGVASGEVLVGDEGVGGPLLEVARRNVGAGAQPAAALERRSDGPFVGRTEELELLRRSRATLVLGPPGIGKSRLVRELARDARVVVGRCSPYGQEALAPLREIARELGSDTLASTPASDVPVVFRRLCAAAAPVTIAVDDLQWAYPIVVDTVEHLAAHEEDGVAVVCLAREELLDDRPPMAPAAQRLRLEPLSHGDAVALGRALGAEDVSVIDRAEGNPLFIEQLLAHAGEGSDALPSSLHSLLVSRLERLTPTERSTIDCAAVAGREFDAALVAGLQQVGSARAALESLVRRGLLDPSHSATAFEERYRFRHALIHDAAYASVPKGELARLHETVADAYDERRAGDEIVGFHLERAATLRPEPDRHGRRLAEEAGERLGTAGVEAWRRGDAATAVPLLERAVALLPPAHAARGDLLCELGTALNTLGRTTDAMTALRSAAEAGDTRIRARAELERGAIGAVAGSRSPDEILELADDAIRVFEAVDDARSLGRALMLAGWIRGGALAQHAEWQEAAERALVQYRRAGWPSSTCAGHIAAALYLGPAPAPAAIERCLTLLDSVDDLAGEAAVATYLGGLCGMTRDFESARTHVERGRSLYVELGRFPSMRRTSSPVEAAITRLSGDLDEAARILEAACSELVDAGDTFHVVTEAADLADILVDLGQLEEAERWCSVAESHRQRRDVDGTVRTLRSRARLTGDIELAAEAVRLADETDGLNIRAAVRVALADVLARDARPDEAAAALDAARDLYRRKGNAAAVTVLAGRPSAAAS